MSNRRKIKSLADYVPFTVDAAAMGPQPGYGPCQRPTGCGLDSMMLVTISVDETLAQFALCVECGLPLVAVAAKRGALEGVTLGSPDLELHAAVEVAAYPQWQRREAVEQFLASGGVMDPALLAMVGLGPQ